MREKKEKIHKWQQEENQKLEKWRIKVSFFKKVRDSIKQKEKWILNEGIESFDIEKKRCINKRKKERKYRE